MGRLTFTHNCRDEVYSLPTTLPQASMPDHLAISVGGAGAWLSSATVSPEARIQVSHLEAHLEKDFPPRPGLWDKASDP